MIKNLVKLTSFLVILALFYACDASNSKKEGQPKEILTSLVGREVTIEYPDMKADVTYLNDSTLHWSTIGENGELAEGTEYMSYKNLGDNRFFINWIEQDGITVSQVVDANRGEVTAFISFNDEASSTGKRSATLMVGKLTFRN